MFSASLSSYEREEMDENGRWLIQTVRKKACEGMNS